MRYTYSSHLKEYIEGLLDQKHALGCPYLASERVLKDFDEFCKFNYPNEKELTKEIGQTWAVIKQTEKPCSFQNRMAPVRELARYINRLGIEAYVISSEYTPKYARQHVPHIFTDSELKLFFAATDRLQKNERSEIRHIAVPVIFRLLYCCGLRPNEVRILKRENIDLSTGMLNIPESKGHKDRAIMIAEDVLELCNKYYRFAKRKYPNSQYFFPSRFEQGNCYSSNWLSKMFWRCWCSSGIGDFSGNRPRPYDFRHTFATNKLYEWMKSGKNLEAQLPYLSAYLGHSNFSQTAYYIHLVPEIFPHMAKMNFSTYEALIPEVEDET